MKTKCVNKYCPSYDPKYTDNCKINGFMFMCSTKIIEEDNENISHD